jgi:hypothetical protein
VAKTTLATPTAPAGAPIVRHVDEIVLAGTKVQVQCVDLPIREIKLDPENPRVANTVSVSAFGTGDRLQDALSDLLWQDPDVRDLYRSVLENKGLVERIIVRHNHVVAEGNCRTVVYRKLLENSKDKRWATIPARVLPEDITDKQIAILLGELHVGGKNAWTPFEKAGHIHKLFSSHGLTQDEIAKLLKTSKTAVNHHIRAFEVMKGRYLPAYPGPGAVRKFSHFLELFKKPELRDWVSHSTEALEKFVRWVGEGRIAHGEDVRTLREIIANPRALAAFDKHGVEAARKVIEEARPELKSPLFKLMVEMTTALEESRLDEIQRVRRDKHGSARAVVNSLKASLDRFIDLCGGMD